MAWIGKVAKGIERARQKDVRPILIAADFALELHLGLGKQGNKNPTISSSNSPTGCSSLPINSARHLRPTLHCLCRILASAILSFSPSVPLICINVLAAIWTILGAYWQCSTLVKLWVNN